MSKMVQPVDTKIVAATTLMQSGILSSMDTETAHIIIAAILINEQLKYDQIIV